MRWLAALPSAHDLCWECGAGRGELSAFLAPAFGSVVATDKSPPAPAAQIVPIKQCPAEKLPLQDSCVDLLLSMQALHHFDLKMHMAEAERVLRKGGIFAALAWGPIELPERVADAYRPIFNAIAPYWEPERDWVLSGYNELAFQGSKIKIPPTFQEREMTLDQLDAEMATWSAVQNALEAGIDFPEPELADCEDEAQFTVRWPIFGQVFRA